MQALTSWRRVADRTKQLPDEGAENGPALVTADTTPAGGDSLPDSMAHASGLLALQMLSEPQQHTALSLSLILSILSLSIDCYPTHPPIFFTRPAWRPGRGAVVVAGA